MAHRAPGFAFWRLILILLVAAAIGWIAVIHHRRAKVAPAIVTGPQTPTDPGPKARPNSEGDCIGFHGGGDLLGVASLLDAPPMQVRWIFRCDDDEEPAAPAPSPTTRPTETTVAVASPSTRPTTRPAAATHPFSATHPTTSPSTHPATYTVKELPPVNTYHMPGNFEASAAIVGGWLFIGDTSGVLRAFDIKTGKIQWRFHAEGGFITTPLVLDGRLFIGDDSGMFYALSAKNGSKIWSFDSSSEIRCSANFLPGGKQIIFATDGGDIFCMEAATGKPVWNQKAQAQVYGTPSVAHGLVFVTGCDQQLRALRTSDGVEQFSLDLGAPSGVSIPVSGDRLVLGTGEGKVLCISATSHQILWTFDKIEAGTELHSSAAISDGIVVFGSRDRNVYALDLATGDQVWTFPTRGEVDSSPVISGGRVYIGGSDKKLYVLDLKTGNLLWSFTAGRGIIAAPAIGNGVLLIGDSHGNLYCLE